MGSIWKSLLDIWNGLSGGQRLTLIGTGTTTIALLAILVWWSQKPQLSLLYAGLDPAEASKISDELRDQKLPFEIANGGRSIYVPNNKVYDLRLKLASKGIPRSGGGGSGGVGFEIFDKPSFGLSDFLQKANYYRALQGELARTISQMEEVDTARVIIVAPSDRLFSNEKSDVKASVFLQLRSQAPLGRQQVNAVRFLVANGVEGLKPSRVAIVDQSGHVLAENEEETTVGLSSGQLEIRKNLENVYASKLQSMLDQVLGAQQSVVRISVDMNFDSIQQTEERFDPASTAIRNESLLTEESTTPVHSQSGVPGTGSNNLSTTNQVETAKATEPTLVGTSKKQSSNNQYDVSKFVQNTMKGMGEIKRVSVAVFINQRFEGTGTEKKAVPRKPEEKTLLENVIKKAVGFVQEGKGKRNDELALEEVPFVGFASTEEAVGKSASSPISEKMNTYLSWAGQGLLVALALGLLFYFRHLLGSIRSDQLKTELSLDAMTQSEKTNTSNRLGGGAPISVSDLSKLIRENPTNMAQALKTWMNQN